MFLRPSGEKTQEPSSAPPILNSKQKFFKMWASVKNIFKKLASLGACHKINFKAKNASSSERKTESSLSSSETDIALTDFLGKTTLKTPKIPKTTIYKEKNNWLFNTSTQDVSLTPTHISPQFQPQLQQVKPKSVPVKSAETAGELFLQLCADSNLSSEEVLNKTKQFHEEFLKSDYDASSGTTLHLLEEKVAEQMEKEGNFSEAFALRVMAASIPLSPTHPLAGKMSEVVPMTTLGTHFSNLDTGTVKGASIHAMTKKIYRSEIQWFDFKISHPAREKLESTMRCIQENKEEFQKSLPEAFGTMDMVDEATYTFEGSNFSNSLTYNISSKVFYCSLGAVTVVTDPYSTNLYNTITVEINPSVDDDKKLDALNSMLSVLGLGPVLGTQRNDDNERIKVAQLFRAYYPKEAFKMERKANFYEMPVEELKQQIEKKVPSMKNKWEELESMYEDEIYPGKKVWCVPSISENMREKGAFGLMAGVYSGGIEESAKTATLILKNGSLSSQDRFHAGLFTRGASSGRDIGEGGGDTVFTRCITSDLEEGRTCNFLYQGSLQILYDLDVVDRGSYGYNQDTYGSRSRPDYAERLNLPDLVDEINKPNLGFNGNEIMVKNRIDPKYIRRLVVQKPEDREVVMNQLQEDGLVQDGKINEIPFEEFVVVAERFSKEMWDKAPE